MNTPPVVVNGDRGFVGVGKDKLGACNPSRYGFGKVYHQPIDTDESNPTARLLLHILASVAEFEPEIIRERTLAGVRHARAKGKAIGRPQRVFRRDEVVRLRDTERLSWRAIADRLQVPVMTAVDAYRSRTENVPQD